ECLIFNKAQNTKKILSSLSGNYKRAPFFENYFDKIAAILNETDDNLSTVNTKLIKLVLSELEINTKILLASDLNNIEGESTDRLISICQNLNASKYLAGLGAKKYQDDELFAKNNIEIINTPFKYPVYHQLWGEFAGNLSVLDVMFNCGPETKQILQNSYSN
ncbi:MAG: WbqC-like family protein, partial [Bacteroidetes bacterium]|nr:WbqC-like family protein [Bacteroidota bacterium]